MSMLFVDTETTGVPDNRCGLGDPSQPRIVELAAILVTHDWVERAVMSMVIQPDGYDIPERMTEVHGIGTTLAKSIGIPITYALAMASQLARKANVMLAFNAEFDGRMIDIELIKAKQPKDSPLSTIKLKDLAEPASRVCKSPPTQAMIDAGRSDQFKTPKLIEAFPILTGGLTYPGRVHSGLADCRAAIMCARALVEKHGMPMPGLS